MRGRDGAFAAFIAVLVVAHFLLRVTFGLGALAPDLMTLAVLLAARRLSPGPAAGVGLLLGVLDDALAIYAFGATAVTYTIIGYLGARSRDLFVGESVVFIGGYLFLGKWLVDVLRYVLLGAARPGDAAAVLLIDAPIAALYLSVVGILAITLYRAAARAR